MLAQVVLVALGVLKMAAAKLAVMVAADLPVHRVVAVQAALEDQVMPLWLASRRP
jgi:3-polyprenyl-4-hydroxybenzoate decarboxylase